MSLRAGTGLPRRPPLGGTWPPARARPGPRPRSRRIEHVTADRGQRRRVRRDQPTARRDRAQPPRLVQRWAWAAARGDRRDHHDAVVPGGQVRVGGRAHPAVHQAPPVDDDRRPHPRVPRSWPRPRPPGPTPLAASNVTSSPVSASTAVISRFPAGQSCVPSLAATTSRRAAGGSVRDRPPSARAGSRPDRIPAGRARPGNFASSTGRSGRRSPRPPVRAAPRRAPPG